MKIRTGYVSNSSSSSFCIAGISFCSVEALLEASTDDLKQKLAEGGMPRRDEYDDDDDWYEALHECDPCNIISHATGLESDGFWEEQDIYVGRSFTDIGEDETPRQFKADINRKLLESFKADVVTVDIHEGTVYS